MNLNIKLTCCILFLTVNLFAQKEVRIASPDGNIVFTLKLDQSLLSYSIAYQKSLSLKIQH